MLSNFKKFIKTKSNWIHVITVFLVIAGFVITLITKGEYISEKHYFQIIGGMFALIVLENFVMLVTYMDDSKSKTDIINNNVEEIKRTLNLSLNKTEEIKYSLDDPCKYIEVVTNAKKCIFCNGVGMAFLSDYNLQTSLANVDTRISIRFVVANHENDAFQKIVTRGIYKSDKKEAKTISKMFDIAIDRIREKRNLNISYVDFFTPISYFAIDYKEKTDSSFIQAKHYLHNMNNKNIKVLYCTVRPGSDLYEYYREQILLLENYNIPAND